MAKAKISDLVAGVIVAGAHTIPITDPADCKTIKVDGLAADGSLNLLRQNFAGNGYEPVFNDGKQVQFNSKNLTATPNEVGTYTVAGTITGPATLWTEDTAA